MIRKLHSYPEGDDGNPITLGSGTNKLHKKVHIEIKINVKLSYIIICVLISSASIQNLSLGRDIFHNIYTKFDSSSCNTEGKGMTISREDNYQGLEMHYVYLLH